MGWGVGRDEGGAKENKQGKNGMHNGKQRLLHKADAGREGRSIRNIRNIRGYKRGQSQGSTGRWEGVG